MFIIDFNALQAIDLLNFVYQVELNGLFAANSQDIVRYKRSFDQRLPSLDGIARVHEEPLAWWDQVFCLFAALAANDNRSFATFAILRNFDDAVQLSNDSRILRLSGFKDFRYARQTTGDISHAGCFTRHFR